MARRRQSKKQRLEPEPEPEPDLIKKPVQDCIFVATTPKSTSPEPESNVDSCIVDPKPKALDSSTAPQPKVVGQKRKSLDSITAPPPKFDCDRRKALDRIWTEQPWWPAANLPKGSVPADATTQADISNIFDITTLAVENNIPLPDLYKKGGAIFEAVALDTSRIPKWTAYTSEWALDGIKNQIAKMPPKKPTPVKTVKTASPTKTVSSGKAPVAQMETYNDVVPASPPLPPLRTPGRSNRSSSIPTKPPSKSSPSSKSVPLPSTPRKPLSTASSQKASTISPVLGDASRACFDTRAFTPPLGNNADLSPHKPAKGFARRSSAAQLTKTYAAHKKAQTSMSSISGTASAFTTLSRAHTTSPEEVATKSSTQATNGQSSTDVTMNTQVIRDSISPDSGIVISRVGTPSSTVDAKQASRDDGDDGEMPPLTTITKRTQPEDAEAPPSKKRKYEEVCNPQQARERYHNLFQTFKQHLKGLKDEYLSKLPQSLKDRTEHCEDYLAEDKEGLKMAKRESKRLNEEFAAKTGRLDEAQKREKEYGTFVSNFEKSADALSVELQASNQLALEAMKQSLKNLEANVLTAQFELAKGGTESQLAQKRVEDMEERVKASEQRVANLDHWDELQAFHETAEKFIGEAFDEFPKLLEDS